MAVVSAYFIGGPINGQTRYIEIQPRVLVQLQLPARTIRPDEWASSAPVAPAAEYLYVGTTRKGLHVYEFEGFQ